MPAGARRCSARNRHARSSVAGNLPFLRPPRAMPGWPQPAPAARRQAVRAGAIRGGLASHVPSCGGLFWLHESRQLYSGNHPWTKPIGDKPSGDKGIPRFYAYVFRHIDRDWSPEYDVFIFAQAKIENSSSPTETDKGVHFAQRVLGVAGKVHVGESCLPLPRGCLSHGVSMTFFCHHILWHSKSTSFTALANFDLEEGKRPNACDADPYSAPYSALDLRGSRNSFR